MKSSNSMIDEIRAVRQALAKASGNDLEKIAEAARARQSRSGRRVVTLRPKKARSAKRVP